MYMRKKYGGSKKIALTAFISDEYAESFHAKVNARIKELQECGCSLEVNYAVSNDVFTALIIGRK